MHLVMPLTSVLENTTTRQRFDFSVSCLHIVCFGVGRGALLVAQQNEANTTAWATAAGNRGSAKHLSSE